MAPAIPRGLQLAIESPRHHGYRMVCAAELRTTPFFSTTPEAAIEALLKQHHLAKMSTGQSLVMESDWGDYVMVLLDGLAKVRSFNSDGEELVYALLGAGDLLGEVAVLDGDSRSADVISLSPVRLLKIPGKAFQALMQSSPEACLALARLEARRLRDLNARFAMQRSDATSRVLFTLAYIASTYDRDKNPLATIPDLPQSEIAIIAGMARETASRVMSKLRGRGDVTEHMGSLRLSSIAPLLKRGIWP